MIVLIKETSGATLTGVIDGVNQAYLVTYEFDETTVNVYVNGLLKVADLDDGFNVIAPKTVVMKEALLVGDTLEIEYQTAVAGIKGGGADGGVPGPIKIIKLGPDLLAHGEDTPGVSAEALQPRTVSGQDEPSIIADNIRPVLIGSD